MAEEEPAEEEAAAMEVAVETAAAQAKEAAVMALCNVRGGGGLSGIEM